MDIFRNFLTHSTTEEFISIKKKIKNTLFINGK